MFSASGNGVIQLERRVIWLSLAIPRNAQCAALAPDSSRRRLDSGKRARKENQRRSRHTRKVWLGCLASKFPADFPVIFYLSNLNPCALIRHFQESKTKNPIKPMCPFGRDCFYQHLNDDGSKFIFKNGVDSSTRVRSSFQNSSLLFCFFLVS